MKPLLLTPVLLGAFLGATSSAHAVSYNLGDLIQNQGSFWVGDKMFGNFGWLGTYFGDGNHVPAAEVTITTLDDDPSLYGIRISAGLNVSGTGFSDGAFVYSVTAAPGHLISDIHQLIGGDGGGGAWSISSAESFSATENGPILGQVASFRSGFANQPADAFNLAVPVQTLWIQKDINASATLGEAHIDFVDQRFSQIGRDVPDAGSTFSLLSGAMGVFGLLATRTRKA